MQATYTLATTTFAATVGKSDSQVNLVNTSGIVPGVFLFVDREVIQVINLTGIGNYATVLRGRDGTEARPHGTVTTVYIAQGYQLYQMDPQGLPGANIFANPHINVSNGTIWVIQGDDEGPGVGMRSWQQVTTTQSIGPVGIRTNTTTTPT